MSIPQARYSSVIPVELLQPIFQLLPQGELFRICALSHTFHGEIVRAMYRHVDLVGSTLAQCTSWARQIVTRCDLAQLTLALSLPGYILKQDGGRGGPVPFLAELLPKAMRAMLHLTSLVIERPPQFVRLSRPDLTGSFLNSNPFLGCPFRLKTFRNEFHWEDSDISPFIHEQSQIQDLEIASCYDLTLRPGSTPASLLPHLSVVSVGYRPREKVSLFTIIAARPLTRLRLCIFTCHFMDAIADIIHTLVTAVPTLTHLHLDFKRVRDDSTTIGENYFVEAWEIIARGFPKLKFLRIALVPSPWEWLDLPRALSAFKGLETLMLDVTNGEHSRGFVRRCMASCPTLRCLAIIGRVSPHSRAAPQPISFIRTPGSDSTTRISSLKALVESAWRDT